MTTKTHVLLNEAECVLCQTCSYVCPAGAINITPHALGATFIVWHNSCTLCGNCNHFCPTKAISLASEHAPINDKTTKYTTTTTKEVMYHTCSSCGKLMQPISPSLLEKGFKTLSPTLVALFQQCAQCRSLDTFAKRVL